MHILFITLYREDLIDEVLSALVELEIGGAIVVDGTAMERILADDVPIFAGLWQTIGDSHDRVRLVMAQLTDRGQLDALFRVLLDSGVDLSDDAVGRLCLVPAEFPEPPSPT